MNIPHATQIVELKRMIPIYQEAVSYCMEQALERGDPSDLHYDSATDLLTYHLVLSDLDRELLPVLTGQEEIWIITRAGVGGS